MAFLTPEGLTDEMTSEELQQLMALGVIPDQQSSIEQQLKTAQALRDKVPQMRHGYRVSTAAHPLEFIVQGIEGYRAKKDMEELRKKEEGLLQQQIDGRRLFYEALRRRGGQQPTQPEVPAQPELF